MGRSRNDDKEFAEAALRVLSDKTYLSIMCECFYKASSAPVGDPLLKQCITAYEQLKLGNRQALIGLLKEMKL